ATRELCELRRNFVVERSDDGLEFILLRSERCIEFGALGLLRREFSAELCQFLIRVGERRIDLCLSLLYQLANLHLDLVLELDAHCIRMQQRLSRLLQQRDVSLDSVANAAKSIRPCAFHSRIRASHSSALDMIEILAEQIV